MEEMQKVLKTLKKKQLVSGPQWFDKQNFQAWCHRIGFENYTLGFVQSLQVQNAKTTFLETIKHLNIWKKKGDKLNIDSYRGIFIVNLFRFLLMKLIYQDKSKTIDANMSDFQIGGRKGRNGRDHIFIVNGIIHDTLSSVKVKQVNTIFADFLQCFDGLSLSLTCKDLYQEGCQDDKLAQFFDINRTNNVAVKTSLGLTDRFELHENVLQGDIFGTVLASNQIDKFGKHCLEDQNHIYMY